MKLNQSQLHRPGQGVWHLQPLDHPGGGNQWQGPKHTNTTPGMAGTGQLYLASYNLWLVYFFWMSKNMVFGDVRFRMKRMEWGWEKQKTSSKKTGLILVPSMLLGKNNPTMTTDVCHNHQEDLHVWSCMQALEDKNTSAHAQCKHQRHGSSHIILFHQQKISLKKGSSLPKRYLLEAQNSYEVAMKFDQTDHPPNLTNYRNILVCLPNLPVCFVACGVNLLLDYPTWWLATWEGGCHFPSNPRSTATSQRYSGRVSPTWLG